MREAAGQNDHVCTAEAGLLVPDEFRLLAEHVLRGVIRVMIAIGAGENDDGKFHNFSVSWGPTPTTCRRLARCFSASLGGACTQHPAT